MEIKDKSTSVWDANTELLQRYRRGDRDAGEELARINSPLVYSIAARFRSRCDDFSELVEAGNIGLVKAMNSFDFERGCVFSTYATPLIFGEIRRLLRDGGIIKVSREQKKLSALLGKERERRLQTGERCDIASIAEAVGVSREDAAAAFFASTPVSSLDEPQGTDEDSRSALDTVYDDESETRAFEGLALRMAIDRLGELERKIVILRFWRDLSQLEVARMLGLSQVKVSREEKKILAKLRRSMT
ncbi:MAG: sigma-70 family RNA polymerase sigma factor [Clostridia bacterium]|nr:sigma-70 family RNA polymerase sigma factor [Clostridia bacterium]